MNSKKVTAFSASVSNDYQNEMTAPYVWSYATLHTLLNDTNHVYAPGYSYSLNNHTNAAIYDWEHIYGNHNDACDNDELEDRKIFEFIVYLMYTLIFIIALIGNGVVCFIVYSSSRMRTVTNYFIVNLSVGDILMTLFCVPFSFLPTLLLHFWPFGLLLCHLVNYSQAVSVLVSAYTLVAISIDRYIAILWPLRPRITKRNASYIICAVWAIALLTALPIPLVTRLGQPEDSYRICGKYVCEEHWPKPEYNYYYTIALLVLQFVIPLLVLVFTYTRIAFAVWGKKPPGEAENSRDQLYKKRRETRQDVPTEKHRQFFSEDSADDQNDE